MAFWAHETAYGFCSDPDHIYMFARHMLTTSSLFRSVVAVLCGGLAAALNAAGPAFLVVRNCISFYSVLIVSESFRRSIPSFKDLEQILNIAIQIL